jgi:hypothetical protein
MKCNQGLVNICLTLMKMSTDTNNSKEVSEAMLGMAMFIDTILSRCDDDDLVISGPLHSVMNQIKSGRSSKINLLGNLN